MLFPRLQPDNPIDGLRRHPQRVGLVWLLVLLLLAQAFIPIQSHTRWAVSDDGLLVELCTLQGNVLVPLQLGDENEDSQARTDIPSPAMAFSQLLTAALSAHVVVQVGWLALVSVETVPAVIGKPAQRATCQTPIRAPPSLF